MAKAPDTTNPSDERNSVSEMVFDMDDNLTRLQSELDVLEELTKDYMLAEATDNQNNVGWTLGKVVGATDELRERFNKVFEATRDRGQNKPEPVTPVEKTPTSSPEGTPTIRDLCHQREIVAAKLALECLERGHEQETIYHLTEPAEARWREIESAILETAPDTIRDVDLVVMLRLARKIIDNDEYATSEGAAEAMLDLIDTTLALRVDPADWSREVQS